MSGLIICPCLHGLEAHDAFGCQGVRATRCDCALSPAQALAAAIDQVRATYARQRRDGGLRARVTRSDGG
jgi:hypothetical protein